VSSTASAVPLGQGGPEASASGPTLTTMLDHLGVPCDDVDTSLSFYTAVFAPLGVHEVVRFPHEGSAVVGLAGADGVPHLWLAPGGPARAEIHLALTAPDRAAVDAVHAAALGAGAEVLHAPREWPDYHPGYYGVFLRDPDGHNAEAVHHG